MLASFYPCTMRPVHPHEYMFTKTIHSHLQKSLAYHVLPSVHTHTVTNNNHSQIQLQNFIYTQNQHPHIHICYDFMTRKNFSDPLFISPPLITSTVHFVEMKNKQSPYIRSYVIIYIRKSGFWFDFCPCVLNEIMCTQTHRHP